MIVCVPITPDGLVAPGWGRSRRVAVATVSDGRLTSWQEIEVGWDALHDEGTEGAHHARVVRFLRANAVEVVVVERLGSGMTRTMTSMGLRLVPGARGDARAAVLDAAGTPTSS